MDRRRRREALRPVWARVATFSDSDDFIGSFPLVPRESGAGVIERGPSQAKGRLKANKSLPFHALGSLQKALRSRKPWGQFRPKGAQAGLEAHAILHRKGGFAENLTRNRPSLFLERGALGRELDGDGPLIFLAAAASDEPGDLKALKKGGKCSRIEV